MKPRRKSAPKSSAAAPTASPSRRWILLSCLGLAALAAGLYANSIRGAFILDDLQSIGLNATIKTLWSWNVFRPPIDSTVAGRPIINLTIAINYAVSGQDVWSYHLLNMMVHAACALVLLGVVRRTLRLPGLPEWAGRHSTPLAWAVAAIWLAHPLQTESVTYVIQRAESIVSLFYLLTLYCFIRAWDDRLPWAAEPLRAGASTLQSHVWWSVAAVAFCAIGMASKEVMATAPLAILLYGRVFLASSWRELLRRRWGLLLGLAATWTILALLIAQNPRGKSTGQGAFATPYEYALTQTRVVTEYLELAFWPDELCLLGRQPFARHIGEVAPYAAIMFALMIATGLLLWRRPAAGFCLAWMLIVLAPTSTIYPIADAKFEHRMYLPLAGLVAIVVLVGAGAVRRVAGTRKRALALGAACLLAALAALGTRTVLRNADYQSMAGMYEKLVRQRPNDAFAWLMLGRSYLLDGRHGLARDSFQRSLSLGETAQRHSYLGIAQSRLGQWDAARLSWTRAVELDANDKLAPYYLGIDAANRGDYQAAAAWWQETLKARPDNTDAMNNLAWLLATCPRDDLRNGAEALDLAQRACKSWPNDQRQSALDTLAAAQAEVGDFDSAVTTCRDAIALARQANDKALATNIQSRLAAYQARKPWRERPTPATSSQPSQTKE